MFGKRKSVEPAAAGRQNQPNIELPKATSTFSSVIVPQSAVDAVREGSTCYKLIQALVEFVNKMQVDGFYNRSEISAKAVQVYHTDYYLAQVNNGGHSQFIQNCSSNLSITLLDVKASLANMNALDFSSLFDRFTQWVATHPQETKQQTGFEGGRAPELDLLDQQFYQLNGGSEHRLSKLMAEWILTWPELRVVADADYQEAMRRAADMNPVRTSRIRLHGILSILHQVADPSHVAIGLACANSVPPELRLEIGAGSYMNVDGQSRMTFEVASTTGVRYCVLEDSYVALHEKQEGSKFTRPGKNATAEELHRAFEEYKANGAVPDKVGKRLSVVKREQIEGVIELSKSCNAAFAIDLLLQKTGIANTGAKAIPVRIEPHLKGPILVVAVLVQNRIFTVRVNQHFCLLSEGDKIDYAQATAAEVKVHLETLK